jgi:DivIVA domain-containing protein
VLTVLSILGVLAVLFVAAAVATREGPILADAPVDMADVELPDGPLQPEDLRAVRFALAIRGYRMDEVDRVIERAASELAERDARIADLEKPRVDPASVAVPVVRPEPETEPEPAAAVGAIEDRDLEDEDIPEQAAVPEDIEDRQVEDEDIPEQDAAPGDAAPDDAAPDDAAPDDAAPDDAAPDDAAPDDAAPDDAAPDDAAAEESPAVAPTSPPVQVAVVRTEVAPIPSGVALPDVGDASADPDETPQDGPGKDG